MFIKLERSLVEIDMRVVLPKLVPQLKDFKRNYILHLIFILLCFTTVTLLIWSIIGI